METILTINDIIRILPHRYPFLLVDRVVEYVPNERVVGIKNVTANEPQFTGHFPDVPIMPGVLIIEAMAQCGALMFLESLDPAEREKKLFYFGGIDKARFRRPVIPGDQLIMEVDVIQRRAQTAKVRGVARVDGTVVAEAELLTVMSDRPE